MRKSPPAFLSIQSHGSVGDVMACIAAFQAVNLGSIPGRSKEVSEKFLPFDWLKVEVYQLNLKYLNVTLNHQIILSHELRKNGGKISRF